MVATLNAKAEEIWLFKSEYKQRVSDYFQVNPDGDYNHFQDTWRRAAQVGRSIFDEVYRELQKRGALKVIENGKTYKELEREIERKVRQQLGAKPEPSPPDFTPVTPTLPKPAPPESVVKQAPLQLPNQNVFASQTPNTQGTPVAKEYKIKELTAEQRATLDRILESKPQITHEDLNAKLGFSLSRVTYHGTMYAVRKGTWHYTHRPDSGSQPHRRISNAKPNGIESNGHTPFVNFTVVKPNHPMILGQIDCSDFSQAETKFLSTHLPTILANLLDKRMRFKSLRMIDDEGDGSGKEKAILEIRRVE